MREISIAIIGAGQRGKDTYCEFLSSSNLNYKIVAIAEPKIERRDYVANKHNIKHENIFNSWDELLDNDKLADAVLICTNDHMHYEPAKLALKKGYHVLLEKPMTNNKEEVDKLSKLAKDHSTQVFMICHVLRYTPFFSKLKEIIDNKEIGDIVSIQHNENIGYYHFAHSFVRGNWRRSDETSPLILAKSCHDLDILNFLVGSKCEKISSFGDLRHFNSESKPSGSANKCLDCIIKETCPYSAKKLYLKSIGTWPATVVSEVQTEEAIIEALQQGPYGRCVYNCDNDVVDNMVTILQYENGVTVTFNLSAFTHDISRSIKIMGTKGEIRGHMGKDSIEIHSFADSSVIKLNPLDGEEGHSGHGGGDSRLLTDFIMAVNNAINGNKIDIKTSAVISAESHRIAFAAEESRLTGKVINLKEF